MGKEVQMKHVIDKQDETGVLFSFHFFLSLFFFLKSSQPFPIPQISKGDIQSQSNSFCLLPLDVH